MAAEYLVSQEITNRNTIPLLPNEPTVQGPSRVMEKAAFVTTVTASAGSTYRFFGLPSGGRLTSLKLRNDVLTGITSAHIGLAEPVAAGVSPAAAPTYANSVTANEYLFASAVDIHAVNLTGTDYAFAITTANACNKRLWELAGYTTDPGRELDVIITIIANSATPTAGNIAMFAAFVMAA